jgi:hypothetical protein
VEEIRPPRFQMPPPDEPRVSEAETGMTSSQLCQLINSLAAGSNRPKLPPPAWPTFKDSYRSYFAFKEELQDFIRDYGQGTSDRTLAQQIKANCLSKNSAAYVEWAWSPAAILETLGGLFGRPSRMVESLLEPVKKQKRIQMDDYPALLAYLTVVRNILQEIKRLGQMQLFNTVSNIDMVVEKMPTSEIEKWMEETEGMRESQLATALEKFILDRWKHCGTIVARTTTTKRGSRGAASLPPQAQGGGISSRSRKAAAVALRIKSRPARPPRVRSPAVGRKERWWRLERRPTSSKELLTTKTRHRASSRSGSRPRRPRPPVGARLRNKLASSAEPQDAQTKISTSCRSA